MISTTSSLADFQAHHAGIYGVTNARHFTALTITTRIGRYASRMSKINRKGIRTEKMFCYLAHVISWTFAAATSLRLNLEDELLTHFPGRCPYCGRFPCDGEPANHATGRIQGLTFTPDFVKPQSFDGLQVMMQQIYPHNILSDSVHHLAGEEVHEFAEAVENYSGHPTSGMFVKVREELVDVFANTLAVGNCLKYSMPVAFIEWFGDGCPHCHESQCRCGYTVAGTGVHSTSVEKLSSARV